MIVMISSCTHRCASCFHERMQDTRIDQLRLATTLKLPVGLRGVIIACTMQLYLPFSLLPSVMSWMNALHGTDSRVYPCCTRLPKLLSRRGTSLTPLRKEGGSCGTPLMTGLPPPPTPPSTSLQCEYMLKPVSATPTPSSICADHMPASPAAAVTATRTATAKLAAAHRASNEHHAEDPGCQVDLWIQLVPPAVAAPRPYALR
jgi:hypothetical protein